MGLWAPCNAPRNGRGATRPTPQRAVLVGGCPYIRHHQEIASRRRCGRERRPGLGRASQDFERPWCSWGRRPLARATARDESRWRRYSNHRPSTGYNDRDILPSNGGPPLRRRNRRPRAGTSAPPRGVGANAADACVRAHHARAWVPPRASRCAGSLSCGGGGSLARGGRGVSDTAAVPAGGPALREY